ncbi:MAG: response regulator transcription factor [Cyclobacteriaceae bacterium]|nr:response regulator transcription factor [Cyclobacteriaceae bacterium]
MSNSGFKVLIVEDESPAAEKLERYLHRYNEAIEVKGKVESVEEAVQWLEVHQATIDLIFMDIQLKDGVSLDIFKEVKVEKPVIFITAYNEYALNAFKMNGIDYLLKPITFTDLSASLQKAEALGAQLRWSDERTETISKTLNAAVGKTYKNRFMVKLGDHIKSVTSDQISLFFADGRDVYLITDQMRKFIIDYTLESLDEILDPKIFYRVNRSYIVNISAIQDVVVFSNSRLKISPHVKWEPQIIVSREKVGAFKEWFDGAH